MKKLNNIIPEFDKLAPIFFLMLLSLVLYSMRNTFLTDLEITPYNIMVFIPSLIYYYFISTPLFNYKEMCVFVFYLLLLSIIVDTTLEFNLVSLILALTFYKHMQKWYITIIKVFLGLLMQYLLMYLVLGFLTNDMLIYTLIYFPFSILFYKGGRLCSKNFFSQRE